MVPLGLARETVEFVLEVIRLLRSGSEEQEDAKGEEDSQLVSRVNVVAATGAAAAAG